MIDLMPLDVRQKRGDFRKSLRGYEASEVDGFLEIVAERMDELVRENVALRERFAQLTETLNGFRGREQALNDALVSAHQLREEVRIQGERDAELTVREARAEAERLLAEVAAQVDKERDVLYRARLHRRRFLRSYRGFLEGQLAEIAEEERKTPVESERPADREVVGDG